MTGAPVVRFDRPARGRVDWFSTGGPNGFGYCMQIRFDIQEGES
jgi:hypothetical protein